MWKLIIFVLVLLFLIWIFSRNRKTGNDQKPDMLYGTIAFTSLPKELQLAVEKFTCEPPEDEKFPIPDDYLVGQEQTKLLKQQDPKKFEELKKKGLVVDLTFNVDGRTVNLVSAYASRPLNQDRCGSCWAFATSSCLTSRIRLYGKKGKSRKFFCFQGSQANPSQCKTHCEACLNSGCCESRFCKDATSNALEHRVGNSGWVEIVNSVQNAYKTSKWMIDNDPKRKPQPQPEPQPPQPQPGPSPTPTPTPKPSAPQIHIPELLVEEMVWPRKPELDTTYMEGEDTYDKLVSLENNPNFLGDNNYYWIYNCISPYYLAGCDISKIAWELDPLTAGAIKGEINEMMEQMYKTTKFDSPFARYFENYVCSGGFPLFASIYLMLQGGLSLKDHNPYLRFSEYLRCKANERKDGCDVIVKSYESENDIPDEAEYRKLENLHNLYVCEDCNPMKVPYYSDFQQCSEIYEKDGKKMRRYIQSQYYACKSVYRFDLMKPDDIKRDIMKYGAAIICIIVTNQLYNLGKNEVYQANVTTEGLGRHAINCCGWIKVGNDFAWICRNSWSENFGNQGFFLCSHAYVDNDDGRGVLDILGMEPFEYYDPQDFLASDEPAELPPKAVGQDDPQYVRQTVRNIIGYV